MYTFYAFTRFDLGLFMFVRYINRFEGEEDDTFGGFVFGERTGGGPAVSSGGRKREGDDKAFLVFVSLAFVL